MYVCIYIYIVIYIQILISLTKLSLKGSYSMSKGGATCAAPVGSPNAAPFAYQLPFIHIYSSRFSVNYSSHARFYTFYMFIIVFIP